MSSLNLICSVNSHLGMKNFAFFLSFFFFISDHSILIVFGKSEFFVDRGNSFEETREEVNIDGQWKFCCWFCSRKLGLWLLILL